MSDLKNVQPLSDFDWEVFENGSSANVEKLDLEKAYDETLNKIQEHQVVEGTVIARKGSGVGETFTVRRVSYGVGVERVFPIHSPNVKDVTVIRRGHVRRAKLYYLRDRVGKAAKVKEQLR